VDVAIVGGSCKKPEHNFGNWGARGRLNNYVCNGRGKLEGCGNGGWDRLDLNLGPFRNPFLGYLFAEKTDLHARALTPFTHYGSSNTYLLNGPQGSTPNFFVFVAALNSIFKLTALRNIMG